MGREKQPLTDRDMETLGELIAAQDSWRDYCKRNERDDWEHRGFAPLDFGGSNGSHHGATATKLVARGLVEHKKRGYEWGRAPGGNYRGSKVYRPTAEGRELFAVWWQSKRDGGDPAEIMGKV
jgi:hypothetical protein